MTGKAKTHKDLDVWKDGIALAKDVYRITAEFPKEETYGLAAQMRRSAVSIPSNIAEGAARRGDKEFTHFLYVALGSASELGTQLEIAKAIDLGDQMKIDEIQKSVDQHFLYVALGSASELGTQLEIAKAIDLGDQMKIDEIQKSVDQIAKMIQGLIRSVKVRPNH